MNNKAHFKVFNLTRNRSNKQFSLFDNIRQDERYTDCLFNVGATFLKSKTRCEITQTGTAFT